MRAARKQRQRAGTLHLVEAENLAGDPFPDPRTAVAALEQCAEVTSVVNGDLVFVAANRHFLDDVVFELSFTARIRSASGRDGADLALLGESPPSWVCRRFRRLAIGSGDHIFGELAATALDANLSVTVVGRPGSVARTFSQIGCEVRYLGIRPGTPTPSFVGTCGASALGAAA